jgi:hypothetical protein
MRLGMFKFVNSIISDVHQASGPSPSSSTFEEVNSKNSQPIVLETYLEVDKFKARVRAAAACC